MKTNAIRVFALCLFLIVMTFVIYFQNYHHGPINADDFHLTTNQFINNAYSYQGLLEGMSSVIAGVWMPLVYLSVGAQMELFGTDFGAYHLVSAGLHAVNAVILLLLLLQMTRAFWPSALTAVFFALHPLNVEPVSWLVCIRVLQAGFFCLLTIYFYGVYAARGSSFWYTLALFCYAAGLFSVPMFPATPFLLLLLDFWPLDRLGSKSGDTAWQNLSPSKIGRAVWEKFPFFGFMAVLMAVLLLSHDLSTSPEIEPYPFWERLFNVFFSYAAYIRQVLLPVNLAVFYPFPEHFPWWKITGSLMILLAVTLAALRLTRRAPFLIVGWLWFGGMLFPLSGMAQIGTQARADHYAYIPMIGLLMMVCWGAAALMKRWPLPRPLASVVCLAIIGLMTAASWRQAGHWKDSETLMAHALTVTRDNYEAHNYLAQALAERGDWAAAIVHFQQALAIKPDHLKSHVNLANVYMTTGRIDKAIGHMTRAVEKDPTDARLRNNLGALYEKIGDTPSAVVHYRQAVAINPRYAAANDNLAVLEAAAGDLDGALFHFQQALASDPGSAGTHFRYALALYRSGRAEAALDHLRRAIDLEPGNPQFRQVLTAVSHGQIQPEKGPPDQ